MKRNLQIGEVIMMTGWNLPETAIAQGKQVVAKALFNPDVVGVILDSDLITWVIQERELYDEFTQKTYEVTYIAGKVFVGKYMGGS